MNLPKLGSRSIPHTTATLDEAAKACCELARAFEDSGDFEQARRQMERFWSKTGERPCLDGLSQYWQAEVLVRAGVLTGALGSNLALPKAQEAAKDLISEGMGLFAGLNEVTREADSLIEISVCYWRLGEHKEARTVLQHALSLLGDEGDKEVKAKAILRSGLVELSAARYKDALSILESGASLFEDITNLSLKGSFNNHHALALKKVGLAENNAEYLEKAFIAYTSASVYWESVGNTRYCALVENNIGGLLFRLGRFQDSHEHLDRGRRLFARLNDKRSVAQLDDTRAQAFIEQNRYKEAEKIIRAALPVLKSSGEASVIAEAQTTWGVSLARLGRHEEAETAFHEAVGSAGVADDCISAGRAWLFMVRELLEYLSAEKACFALKQAKSLLLHSQDASLDNLLKECMQAFVDLTFSIMFPSSEVQEDSKNRAEEWRAFSLTDAVYRYKEEKISKALKDARGELSLAARYLGISPQNLHDKLKGEFKQLRFLQSNQRKKSVIKERGTLHYFPARQRRDVLEQQDVQLIIMPDDSLSNLGVHFNDRLVVKCCKDVGPDLPVAVLSKAEIHVGYYSREGSGVWIDPGNNEYEAECLSEETVEIIGQVVGYVASSEISKPNPKVALF